MLNRATRCRPAHPSAFGSGEPDPEFSRGEPAPIGRGTIPQYAGSGAIQPGRCRMSMRSSSAPSLHSARSFLGLFLVVVLVFLVLTGLIYVIPSASADTVASDAGDRSRIRAACAA